MNFTHSQLIIITVVLISNIQTQSHQTTTQINKSKNTIFLDCIYYIASSSFNTNSPSTSSHYSPYFISNFKQNLSQMLQTQFSRLKNITSQSSYMYNTIKLNQQKQAHFKHRLKQIQNQFDLVDFQKRGFLYRSQIQDYLEKKYQWVNKDILNSLFNTMNWKRMQSQEQLHVERKQFCTKYLQREKQLFYEQNKLESEQQWFNSLFNIYQRTIHLRPLYFVSVQILKLELYQNNSQDFINVNARYQNHQQKLQFDINQNCYDITKPSFQLILPSQENEFFLVYNFTNTKNHELLYGNAYVRLDLRQKDKPIPKQQQLAVDVRKNGAIVGRCRIFVSLQTQPETIRQKLKQKSLKIRQNQKQFKSINLTLSQVKKKQYEYVQFLWGIRHLPPQKIQHQDIIAIVVLRTVFIILLGGFGVVVHVLGRCQPLSIICVFLLLKWRTYVILKVEVFLITWLLIASMLLDGIWLVFSSHHVSQINYLNLHSAMTLTYFLLGSKALFFIYLLIFEKPFFSSEQQKNQIAINDTIN